MKKIFEKSKKIIQTATFRQSTVTTAGSLGNSLLSVAYYFLLGRLLGPENFGIFTVLTSLVVMVGDFSDFGIIPGISRFVPLYERGEQEKAQRFIKASLILKIAAALATVFLVLTFSGQISALLFKGEINQSWLALAIFGIVPMGLMSFFMSLAQARQKFGVYLITNAVYNLLRLGLTAVFFFIGEQGVLPAVILFLYGPLLSVIFAFKSIKPDYLKVSQPFVVVKEMFAFNKWNGLSIFLAAIYSRVDALLLFRFGGAEATGLYTAALKFTMFFSAMSGGLSVVFNPKFATMGEDGSARRFYFKTFLLTSVFIIPLAMAVPLAPFLVRVMFGEGYLAAIGLLPIVFLGIGFYILNMPAMSCLMYYFGSSKIITLLNIQQLAAVLFFDFLLIPRLGAFGASWAFVLVNICLFLSANIIVLYKLNQKKI